ncbi:MAG: hypothetical protein IIC93_11385, partial [Chloroflexi bacterium]|nr:hypothetical protein [Chloroflexota bacterium]
MSFGIIRLKFKWWAPILITGAMVATIACGSDTVETVIQTVLVERQVAGETVVETVIVTKETIVEKQVAVEVQVVVTATPGRVDDTPAPGTPSGTLTIAWPAVFSFVGMPSANGGRQGERLVWLGIHETANRMNAAAQIVPHLAESWTISTDGTRHTVKLSEGDT